MPNGDDRQPEILDSTGELLGEWNLSETLDHRRLDERRMSRRSNSGKASRREVTNHRIDKQGSRGGPHCLARADRQSDTALIGAFELESRDREQDDPNDHSWNASVADSPRVGENETRLKSSPVPSSDRGQSGTRFPRVGDVLSGFRIKLELGRGAFARVYLAEETNLGGRLVAIKVSKAEGDEPQVLARLQHTHIVPVHSLHTDPTSGLRILCMPYFGGANLAEVLESAVSVSESVVNRTGHSLIQALDRVSRQPFGLAKSDLPASSRASNRDRNPSNRGKENPSKPLSLLAYHAARPSGPPRNPIPGIVERILGSRIRRIRRDKSVRAGQAWVQNSDPEAERPARRFLRGASGIQAAVWIVARLAEGLEHAHGRGLLHRDIKPSNILIAADGAPMLLDFNLAVEREAASAEEGVNHAMIGGTLPYMSPEHLDAFNPRGSTRPEEVDGRSDIYALGLILYEMIAGHHPFPEPPPQKSVLDTIQAMLEMRRKVPSLRAARPDAPWSLNALVAKCLDPNPDRRYLYAGELAEDLRRFLDNLPMKHCPEPSLRERIGKWTRRHPAISSSTSVGLLGLLMVLGLGASITVLYNTVQNVAARLRLQEFGQSFADSQFWLNTQSDRIDHLKKGLSRSQKALKDLGVLESSGEAVPRWLLRLPTEERAQIFAQAVELTLLDAQAGVKLAEKLGNESDRRVALERAIQLVSRVEQMTPSPPAALYSERARFQDALGHADLAESDRRKAAETPLSTSYDYLVLGGSLLANGKPIEAESALKEAIKHDVTSFWAWFALGHSYYQQGRYSDAVAAFTGCVVRGPKFAWAHFNLGLALAKSGRLLDAKSAYDRSIELDPVFPEAFINRGLVELELNQLSDASRDLQRGIANGRDDPGILAAYGETLARLGRQDEAERFFTSIIDKDPDAANSLVARGMTRLSSNPQHASEDFRRALDAEPAHAVAHYGMARVLRSQNPAAALAHLNESLKSDPGFLDAVQLRALMRARIGDPGTVEDVERLLEKPTPHRLYNAACALAVYSDAAKDSRWLRRSIDLVSRALRLGFPRSEARADPDLNPLRKFPEFQSLIDEGNKRAGT